MTKIAYLDCPTGIAGDMFLGALVDAGVPMTYLTEQLEKLGIKGEFQLRQTPIHHNGQLAHKLHVDLINSAQDEATAHHHGSEQTHSQTHHEHHQHGHSHSHSHSHSHHHSHSHTHSHSHHQDPQSAHDHSHTRCLPEIEHMIQAADLPQRAESWSLAVFRQLALAEGAVHGIPAEAVFFHEVGAIDAIVDIVGTCLGLDYLQIEQLYCAALPTGGGSVWAAHGRLPVPVPAVLKLWELRQVPVFHNGIDRELVTPTGAALVSTIATDFGAPPPMTIHKTGLGAGSLSLPIPNIARLWIGAAATTAPPRLVTSGQENKHEHNEQSHHPAHQTAHVHHHTHSHSAAQNTTGAVHEHRSGNSTQDISNHDVPNHDTQTSQLITVLETQIDDLNPQAIGYVFDRLFEAGAWDVFTQAIGMKKSRPGILLTIICPPTKVAACEQIIFQETTTLGIRRSQQQRTALDRAFHHVHTEFGNVHIKVAKLGDRIINAQPEYEDCAAIARKHDRPWREIHQLALQLWQQQESDKQAASQA